MQLSFFYEIFHLLIRPLRALNMLAVPPVYYLFTI